VAFNPKEPIAQLKTHILSLLGNTPITTENIQLQLDGTYLLNPLFLGIRRRLELTMYISPLSL
jgi:hypothetical protein